MARISGVDLPRNKKIQYALTYIHGIGKNVSNDILDKVGIDKDIRVKYGNIHKIKGTTFDNVVGDLSLYRYKAEPLFVQRRLLYTMFSRGIYDAWVLKSQTGKELGNYGYIR